MRANLRNFILMSASVAVCAMSSAALLADTPRHPGPSGAISAAATDSLGPQDGCTSVVANLLRTLRRQPPTPSDVEKLKALPAYEKQEAACRTRMKAWSRLSPEERKQEIGRREVDVQTTLRAMAETERNIPTKPSNLGIGDPLDTALLGKEFIPAKNAWSGYVDSKLVDASGSAHVDDPAKGVVFVMEDGIFASGRAYDAPTATGPLKVISAAGEVVTLRSTGGKYTARDPADGAKLKTVHPKGGTLYHFNLRTRTFE
jgi:hypothetical protein